jgi:hypothetical protein
MRHRLCEVGSVEPTALHWPGETQGARAGALQASMIGIEASSSKAKNGIAKKKSFISSRLIASFAISPVPLVMLTA